MHAVSVAANAAAEDLLHTLQIHLAMILLNMDYRIRPHCSV